MDSQFVLNSQVLLSLGLKNISSSDKQKISLKLASLSMDVLLDVVITNLKSDEELSFWLELANRCGDESQELIVFLKEKIPNFDKLYQEALTQEIDTIKKSLTIQKK